MILATTTVEDYDRFLSVFSTKGADKRRQHGCKGATVFRDPNEADRLWAVFDWDAEGWQSFVSDPEVPPIMQEAGHKGRPPPGRGDRRPLRRLTRGGRIVDGSRRNDTMRRGWVGIHPPRCYSSRITLQSVRGSV